MKAVLTVVLVTVGMLLAVACGKASSDDGPGETTTTAAALGAKASCDRTIGEASCDEYRTGTSFGLERSLCEGKKGRFVLAACPAEGRVGACELGGGEVKRYYATAASGRAFTPAEAKADCAREAAGGRFVAANER